MRAGEGEGLDARAILDRRRLRRRLGLWRLLAIAAVAAAVATIGWRAAPEGGPLERPHVARFAVEGVILDDPDRDRTLRRLAESDAARAVIVRIDSPGGTVTGSEALFQSLRAIAERKPVVAVMGEAAASGGYIAALAADRILARGGTLTGSIGVVAEFPNIQELLDNIGVGFSRVASGPLKAEPSPLREPSPEVLAAQEALIADSYAWFIGLVAERRGFDEQTARALGDGRVFTGRQAAAVGLVDQIGGEPEARDWLADARGVARNLPVRDVEVDRPRRSLFALVEAQARRALLEAWAAAPRLMAVVR
ncbi:MAG: signal peptide peptidase SppA [Rubrimonas sp.]